VRLVHCLETDRNNTSGQNTALSDCVPCTRDVTTMMSSSKYFKNMCLIKLRMKSAFSICYILKINRIILFYNLFMGRPLYVQAIGAELFSLENENEN